MKKNKAKGEIDWPAIEKDYRAGTMSNAALAEWYSLGESTIRMRAKRYGWVRAQAKPVPPAAPSAQKAPPPIPETPVTRDTTSPEAIIGRGRNLTLRLMDELDATTSRLGELREIIDFAVDREDVKAREAIEKVLSLKERSDVLKSLALTAKTLAEAGGGAQGKKAERQAKADAAAAGGGKFAVPPAPKLVVDNQS